MEKMTTDSINYSNIAGAIRAKTGSETQYQPAEMPTGVEEVFEAGKVAGVAELPVYNGEFEVL